MWLSPSGHIHVRLEDIFLGGTLRERDSSMDELRDESMVKKAKNVD